jgi:hypothetical protein
VLATTRRSQGAGGFEILQVDSTLRFRAGDSELARLPWPQGCPLEIAIRDGALQLPGRAVPLHIGTPGEMPIVTGLFTGLDLRSGAALHVDLRTRAYATSQTTTQVIADLLAVLAAGAALLLLAGVRPRRGVLSALWRGAERAWDERHVTDAVVIGVLLAWWILAPTFFDDGWVLATESNYSSSGGFSTYYDQFGANQPLGFWLDWSRHWLAAHGLVLARLSALFCLMAGWLLCRRVVVQIDSSALRRGSVRWVLAAAFLVGALAWGMTLRPEPVVSLLTLTTLAAMVSCMRQSRLAPLTIATPAAALAVTAHTTGLVALAPLLAGHRVILRLLRSDGRQMIVRVAALVAAACAFGLVVYTIGADLGTRFADARLVREGGLHSEPPWREYLRYADFDDQGGATAVRRLSLALLLLSVVAVLTRRRSICSEVMVLPAHSVGVALLLLAFVPSKWPWHFGALAGIGAVAVAAEASRIGREHRTYRRIDVRLAVGFLTIAAAAMWAWTRLREWTPFDLQGLHWDDAFNVYSLLVVCGLVVAAVIAGRRRALSSDSGAGRRSDVIGAALVIVSFSVVALTGATVIVDAATTSWSLARQNLESIAARTACDLADEWDQKGALGRQMADSTTRTFVIPTLLPYLPCVAIPKIKGGFVEAPNLLVVHADGWPFTRADSPFVGASDLYRYRVVARGPHGTVVYSVRRSFSGFGRVDAAPAPSHA